jgi:hypothetical protein
MAAVTPDEIERKLEQLRRIAGVESPTRSVGAEGAPHDPGPAPTASPPLEAAHPATDLAELSALVERMEAAAADFAVQVGALSSRFAEIAAVLDRNGQVPAATAAVVPPSPAPAPVAAEPEPRVATPGPAREEIEIEVGPFGDITEVSSFVQALAEVQGVNDVYVRGFESANALLEVRLQREVDLAGAMLEAMPGQIELRAIDDARVSVSINADARSAVE